MVTDHHGNSLNERDRDEAWLDDVWYTATVKIIKPHEQGCANHRHITLIRADNQAVVETFSGAVVVIS